MFVSSQSSYSSQDFRLGFLSKDFCLVATRFSIQKLLNINGLHSIKTFIDARYRNFFFFHYTLTESNVDWQRMTVSYDKPLKTSWKITHVMPETLTPMIVIRSDRPVGSWVNKYSRIAIQALTKNGVFSHKSD